MAMALFTFTYKSNLIKIKYLLILLNIVFPLVIHLQQLLR